MAAGRHSRTNFCCRAEPSEQAQQDTQRTPAQAQAPPGVVTGGESGRRPRDTQLRLEKVERLGEEAWAGVAAVDREESDGTSLKRAAILVGGDAAAVLLFAAIGRGSHAELDGIAGVLTTAWPFLAGWYTGATFTGAYGAAAQRGPAPAAAGAAAKAWAVAIVLSLALRSASRGAPPPVPFAVVASVATAVLLIGWRSAFAAFSPAPVAKGRKMAGSGNKSGNPFEFLQLLGSLTKRW
eukprot:CAMPEP_0206143214 /NCGR_PEP_ID=MMETSP1473-20131121/19638_1 /ASSEMBLY_ACC=CAM_ASM_001109 /TAXON_ID=1461547 /ORGANISM="Stichococcus sp, Strain RCC1054" /LENGTH=237 /DNA_ID=CAMNT_0053538509 /DNA_START=195 /DNA_END=908 /DNA_ORIENTATION=+